MSYFARRGFNTGKIHIVEEESGREVGILNVKDKIIDFQEIHAFSISELEEMAICARCAIESESKRWEKLVKANKEY